MSDKATMTKEEAEEWAWDCAKNGISPEMNLYKERFGVGTMADSCWDDGKFKYGIEYGILIAFRKIYGDLDE